LTVSSQVIHEPHGMTPPEQLFIVPFRLVKASTISPCGVTWVVVVPPPPCASYGVPSPNGRRAPETSWLRTSHTFPSGALKAPIP